MYTKKLKNRFSQICFGQFFLNTNYGLAPHPRNIYTKFKPNRYVISTCRNSNVKSDDLRVRLKQAFSTRARHWRVLEPRGWARWIGHHRFWGGRTKNYGPSSLRSEVADTPWRAIPSLASLAYKITQSLSPCQFSHSDENRFKALTRLVKFTKK